MSLFNKAMAEALPAEGEKGAPDTSGVLGGREVDANGKNSGNLRCPVCTSRILTTCGTLHERHGKEQDLWVPTRPKKEADGSSDDTGEEEFTWEKDTHQWWWCVPDIDAFSSVGLSRLVETPQGKIKLVLCSECQSGPYGYQLEPDPRVWLCCALLKQQEASLANDEEDFRIPENVDVAALRKMIAKGSLSSQFDAVFEEQRLGMMLGDNTEGTGVEVFAFTEFEGAPGAVELSGKVSVGDIVVRVNDVSTNGLGYEAVLEMIINSARPVTLRFERNGPAKVGGQPRVAHQEWEPSTPKEEGTTDTTK